MFLSAMMQTSLAVLAAAPKNPDDIPISVVVVTGLVLVFFILPNFFNSQKAVLFYLDPTEIKSF